MTIGLYSNNIDNQDNFQSNNNVLFNDIESGNLLEETWCIKEFLSDKAIEMHYI